MFTWRDRQPAKRDKRIDLRVICLCKLNAETRVQTKLQTKFDELKTALLVTMTNPTQRCILWYLLSWRNRVISHVIVKKTPSKFHACLPARNSTTICHALTWLTREKRVWRARVLGLDDLSTLTWQFFRVVEWYLKKAKNATTRYAEQWRAI